MRLNTKIIIDFNDLNKMLEEHAIPHDGFSRLMMNDYTVHSLTGKHFYDDRRQSYYGFPIIECYDCAVGEVILLVNYERFFADGGCEYTLNVEIIDEVTG